MSRKALVTGTVVTLVAGLAVLPFVTSAWSDSDERYPAVTDAATVKECGACHMAFQPQMLPKRSWRAIMGDLQNHFGEDASLPADQARHIENYLTANAGDAGKWQFGAVRGLKGNDTPLRISETPFWVRAHRGEVRPGAFSDPRVGSKANCVACHRGAEKGYYEDD